MCYNQAYGYGARNRAGRGWGPWGQWGRWHRSVPVNIEEKSDSFELSLYAPSLVKENIKITTKDDVLTVSYAASAEEGRERENFTRREYQQDSFERSFVLNGKVDAEKISATYSEGVLKVTLPKNPATNKPAQDVQIT
jgi:HSP20 family protein